MYIKHNEKTGFVTLSTQFHEEAKRFKQTWNTNAYEHRPEDKKVGFPEDDRFMHRVLQAILDDMPLISRQETIMPPSLATKHEFFCRRDLDSLPALPTFTKNPATGKTLVPFPHQEQPIRESIAVSHYELFMKPGTGKTAVMAAHMAHFTQQQAGTTRFLYVTKKTLVPQTTDELTKWIGHICTPHALVGSVAEKGADIDFYDIGGIVFVTNYEALRPKVVNGELTNPLIEAFKYLPPTKEGKIFTAIYLDECDCIRNHTEHGRGLDLLRVHAKRRIIASGTPAPQGPDDYAHQCNFLHPGILPHNTRNAIQQAWGIRSPYGQVKEWSPAGMKKLADRVNAFGCIMGEDDLRRMGIHIPICYSTIRVEMTPKQRKAYDEMCDELIASYEKQIKEVNDEFATLMSGLWGEGPKLELQALKKSKLFTLAQNMLVKMLRLTQITGGFATGAIDRETGEKSDPFPIDTVNPKLNALVEFIRTEQKVVVSDQGVPSLVTPQFLVFCTYRHEVQAVKEAIEELGITVGTFQGSQETLNERNKQAFVAGKITALVINIASGKYGHNLQNASLSIYYNNTSKLLDREQSECRTARLGQAGQVRIVDIVCSNSIDISTLAKLRNKKELSDNVLYKLRNLVAGKLEAGEEEVLDAYDTEV